MPKEGYMPRFWQFWDSKRYDETLFGQNRPARKMKSGYLTEIRKLSKGCSGDDVYNWEDY